MESQIVIVRCPVRNCQYSHTQEIQFENEGDKWEYAVHIEKTLIDAHPKHEHGFIAPHRKPPDDYKRSLSELVDVIRGYRNFIQAEWEEDAKAISKSIVPGYERLVKEVIERFGEEAYKKELEHADKIGRRAAVEPVDEEGPPPPKRPLQ